MTEQELVEKIAKLVSGRHHLGYESAFTDAEDVVFVIKEAGKIYSQEEVQGIVDVAIMRARLGYVKVELEAGEATS